RHADPGNCIRRSGQARRFHARAHGRRGGCRPGRVRFPLRRLYSRAAQGTPRPRRYSGAEGQLIIPCIDLMDGKVVQLVQGKEKALEADSPAEMLRKFSAFPEIQVIDLNAAIGNGANDGLIEFVASRAKSRVGGGVRTVARAQTLVKQGAYRVIVGTA